MSFAENKCGMKGERMESYIIIICILVIAALAAFFIIRKKKNSIICQKHRKKMNNDQNKETLSCYLGSLVDIGSVQPYNQ